MDGIKKPKVVQLEMRYYDESEAQLAIEALYKEPMMWRLFCIGAILGLPEWFMEELKDYHHKWKVEKLKAGELWEGAKKSIRISNWIWQAPVPFIADSLVEEVH